MIWLALLLGCGNPPLPTVKKPCDAWKKPGTYDLTLQVGRLSRRATVVVPKTKGPRDLVVALHGLGGNASAMARATEFHELADREGVVVAYAQGVGWPTQTSWNAGTCCEGAMEANVPDAAYLDALVDELQKRTCTDKVLAAGFSNGGAMVQRWACVSDKVDAVVSAGAPYMHEGACKRGPVPIRQYHGLIDPIVPMTGRTEEPLTAPVREAFETWRKHNRCKPGKAKVVQKGKMTCQSWSCAVPTQLCVLEDWKHRWPGGPLAEQAGFDAAPDALDLLP